MLLIDLHMKRFRHVKIPLDTACGRWLKNYVEAGQAWHVLSGHGVLQESVSFSYLESWRPFARLISLQTHMLSSYNVLSVV